jgi:LacI family transcriptional regulator
VSKADLRLQCGMPCSKLEVSTVQHGTLSGAGYLHQSLREDASGLVKTLNVVGLDLTPEARSGLLDGVVNVILSHPIKPLAETTVELLASVTAGETNGELVQRLLPFDIYTPENL